MPSPAHTLWSRVLPALLTLASLVFGASSHAAEWGPSDLMGLLAQQKSGKAVFVEKKYMAMLDKPLESSGELSFDAPDRLEKRTLKPRQESMLLDGDTLTVNMQGKRPMSLRLQDHPGAAAMVESIRGTLAGDLGALEKNYALELSGAPTKWQLTLKPTNKDVAKIVRLIQIGGADANIKAITFEQADGDRMEMTVSKISPP